MAVAEGEYRGARCDIQQFYFFSVFIIYFGGNAFLLESYKFYVCISRKINITNHKIHKNCHTIHSDTTPEGILFDTAKQTALHLFNRYLLLFILYIRHTTILLSRETTAHILNTHHMPQITLSFYVEHSI